MSDENARKPAEDSKAAGAARRPQDTPAEPAESAGGGVGVRPGVAPEIGPEVEPGASGPSIDELMPGLAGQVEAERAARLEAEAAELRDKLLRALAETENVRRRAERDRKDAEAFGGTRLARDLLQVYDNLDRALAHVDDGLRDQAQSFIEGVELTRRELLNAFSKHRIEQVTPAAGEKFDPNLHQAMFEAPIPGAEPGTVIEVMQAGFTIAGRLLRPALVGVAKAAPAAADGGGGSAGGDAVGTGAQGPARQADGAD